MVKRGRKKGGAILPAVIGGVTLAHKTLQKVKPATMADAWLKSNGYETDPSKLSGVKWLGATALKAMREKLGWGIGQSGSMLYGQSSPQSGGGNVIQGEQYGVPSLVRSEPKSLTQIKGSGRKKGMGKKKVLKL